MKYTIEYCGGKKIEVEAETFSLAVSKQRSNLHDADLRGADLRGADLDFSCWPLWCGTRNVKTDWEIFKQLVGHVCWLDCEDERAKKIQELLLPTAKEWEHWQEQEG
jgi:hypothetical protein